MNTPLLSEGGSTLQAMIYYPIPDIWFYLLAAAVLQAVAVYTWRFRQSPAALYLSLSTTARVVWLLALVLITVSPTLESKIFWAKAQQLSAIVLLPIALMIALHITDQKPSIIRGTRIVMLTLTAFLELALLTSDWYGLYWRGIVWDGVSFGFIRGPLYWAGLVICYLTFMVALAIYFRQAARTSGLRCWQALALPVDMIVSAAGHICWLLHPQGDFVSSLPLGFMLGSLAWFIIFLRLRVFNLQELAEAAVSHDMNDCLIIVDAQNYVVELNPAARQLFGEQPAVMVGSRFETAFALWPSLAQLLAGREVRTGEIPLAGGYYLFRVTPLTGWGNRNFGKAIVLHDVGALKKAQEQIIEQQKALSIIVERERLRRELHDGAGQIWGYLKLQYQQIRELLADHKISEIDDRLQKLARLSDDFHSGVRDSLAGLKTSGGKGLMATLSEFMQWYKSTYGINTCLSAEEEVVARLSPMDELQLLRIIQEAMANARKHASPSLVQVEFCVTGEQAAVIVTDDGCGFDINAPFREENRHGLGIIRERVGELGGRLEIQSTLGVGTKVTVWLPSG